MTRTPVLLALLALAGAAWGATQPLAKIAVSQGHQPFGILFWQMALGGAALGVLMLANGKRLVFGRAQLLLYLVIALLGSVLPGIASYSAAVHLPAGVLSILLSSIPMLAFPIALLLRVDQFRWRRMIGLGLGFAGVLLLVLPSTTLPDPAQAVWIPIALIASAFYALEGNVVAKWGTQGLDAVQVLCGASLLGAMITLPLAIGSGQWIDPIAPWGPPELAIFASALLHAMAYVLYVWMVGQAGSVFAVQVSYLVTLFGVIWAMVFLGETYTGYIWAALLAMLAGLFFVQPRPKAALASVAALGQSIDRAG